jgi:cell division protein FtsQ
MKRPISSSKLPAEKLQQKRLAKLGKASLPSKRQSLRNNPTIRLSQARALRRAIGLIGFSSLAMLTALVAVLTFSPILAIKEISVSGTDRIDSKEISLALNPHLGTPLPLLNPADISESLAGFEVIESFSTIALPPNGLSVSIIERQPICIIDSATGSFLYDPAGVKLGKAKSSDVFPKVLIQGVPASSVRFQNAISVLMSMPADLLGEIEEIDAKSQDNVSMVLRTSKNQRIVWGDSSQSALKSKVLEALMSNHKKTQSVTFDVSAPNAPVVRYDNF